MTHRKKLVDTTFFNTQVPSTHTPSFGVAHDARLVTPNLLPQAAAQHATYVILGGGKTAMDVGVWLLQMGARPDKIRWIVPRESWLINRDTTQPGEAFFPRSAGGQLLQFEAAAEAGSVGDLFDRLERTGQLLRIDQSVRPTKFSGATISAFEVEMLRAIKDVVRKGYVRNIDREAIMLDEGVVNGAADPLYIDCTASAFKPRATVPVFDGNRITIQLVRNGQTCLSSALTAHVEATYDDEAEKNEICGPVQLPSTDLDWARWTLADLRNARRWGADKALRRWVQEHRLSGAGVGSEDAAARGAEAERIREGLRAARPRAEASLARLVGDEA